MRASRGRPVQARGLAPGPGTARAARDAAAGGAAPKFRCGNSAWEHEIVLMYNGRGLHGLGDCLAEGKNAK